MADNNPTPEQLAALADFIDDRCYDDTHTAIQARATADATDVYLDASAGYEHERQHLQAWADQFTPDRALGELRALTDMARHMAEMARDTVMRRPDDRIAFGDARRAYILLVRTARLWAGHQAFLPEWADSPDQSAKDG